VGHRATTVELDLELYLSQRYQLATYRTNASSPKTA